MSDHDLTAIKRKSLRGVLALLQQTFVLQVTGVLASLVQIAYLRPEEFGVYGVANSIIALLTYFSDVGLAGALIQKKQELTKEDLATTFTIQQILVLIIVVVGFFCTSLFANFYRLSDQGRLLFQVLLFCFFVSSFKTIPAILLERKLDFQKLIIPQIVETLLYNFLLAVLAWKGFGIASFMWAALARSVVGLITMYCVSPWRISIGFNKTATTRLFRFGIPYQLNSLLAMVKDDLLFLMLGRLLPLSSMGYIYVAKKLSDLPLRTILDSVTRVTFPTYSRLQHNVSALRKGLENTTFGIAMLVFPIYISGMFLIQPFITLFPKYGKWEPALLSFYFLSITSMAASFSTPLVSALNAIGKIRITLLLMIMWIVLTWLLVVPLVSLFGFNGFGFSLMLISLTVFVVIAVVKRYVMFSFFENIRVSLLGMLLLALWYWISLSYLPITLPFVFTVGVIGAMLYMALLWLFERNKILSILQGLRGK